MAPTGDALHGREWRDPHFHTVSRGLVHQKCEQVLRCRSQIFARRIAGINADSDLCKLFCWKRVQSRRHRFALALKHGGQGRRPCLADLRDRKAELFGNLDGVAPGHTDA